MLFRSFLFVSVGHEQKYGKGNLGAMKCYNSIIMITLLLVIAESYLKWLLFGYTANGQEDKGNVEERKN